MPRTARSAEELSQRHSEFIDDCAIRILCVFALDKFADYASGQVIM